MNRRDFLKNNVIVTATSLAPRLSIPEFTSLDEILDSTLTDYILLEYDPMSSIPAPMAV